MVLRYLLKSWLANAAGQKVRDEVLRTARQQLHSAMQHPPAPAADDSAPCHTGVVFALGIEAGGLEDLLDGVITIRGEGIVARRGGLSGRRVILAFSGPGRQNAAKATDALLAGHRPRWVFSAGFAGGLDPRLRHADILVADRLVDITGNQLPVDLPPEAVTVATAPGVHVGRLLTADHVIRLPEQKHALGHEYNALAVDMETFAVAEVCRRSNVPFLAVRVIHDAVDDHLPRDIERLLAQKSGAAQLGAALGAIVNRPSSVKDLLNLKQRALVASDRLAKFLAALVERLSC
jgi:adenosylhomocysteine nucleosidase